MADLRYAIRMLLKQPGFTIPVVLALALGIGVNTTIFGFVDGLLFKPLPIERLDEVVRVSAVDPESNPNDLFNSSYPVYTDYRDQATSFAGLAAYADSDAVHLTVGAGKPDRLIGGLVSGRYFEVLGTKAWRGHLIGPDDDRKPGGHAVAVISYGLWRRSFAGRDDAVGRDVRINGQPFTVIGVAPPGFVGVSLDNLPELWMPMMMAAQAMPEIAQDFKPLESRHFYWVNIVGRLKPNATVAQAQAELDVIARRRAAPQPKSDREPFARVVPAATLVTQTEATSRYQQMSWVLLGVVGLVLLIACGDAAALLLVRGEQRQREIAIRVAVGATRGRVIRQLLVESLVLAGLASAAGVLVASWSADGLLALLPADFPLVPSVGSLTSQPRVLAFTIAVTMVAGLVFGLAPALRTSRPDLVPALKQDPARARNRRIALRHAFVVSQIALSVLLLVGAGLLIRTVRAFTQLSPGFTTERIVVGSVDVSLQGYHAERSRSFFEALTTRVASVPGVSSVALGRMVPVDSSGMRVTFTPAGRTPAGKDSPVADYNPVSPGYFATLGIPLVEGRDFSARDLSTAPPVVIVNQALARRYFGTDHAVGQRLIDFGPAGGNPEIVGVVGDARYRTLRDEPAPMIYVPHAQGFMPRMSLVVRTAVAPESIIPALTAVASSLDADLPLFQVRTMRERMQASLAVERLLAWLLAGFAALAVFLAAAGLYGVVSYLTTIRTKEYGIRLALGATGHQLRNLVVRQTLILVGLGLATGLALSAAGSRLLTAMLFEVSPIDALTYLSVTMVLWAVGLLAAQWPARRASRVDPVTALRYE
jgi:putative ABC transport system permease protein